MCSLILLVLLMQLTAAAATPLAANITLDGCERKCGEVTFPTHLAPATAATDEAHGHQ